MNYHMKMHLMIRLLALNLSTLGKYKRQYVYPEWISLEDWGREHHKVDPVLSHELMKACMIWTPNPNTWGFHSYIPRAMLEEFPPKHQAEFIRLFKLLHPPSWTSSPQTNLSNC